MDTSTFSLVFTGVVPPVCDAEAGEVHRSKAERPQANASTDIGSSTHLKAEEAAFDRALDRAFDGTDLSHADSAAGRHGFSMRKLRSVMTELCSAIRSALDDERGIAEDSLQRATRMLQEIGEAEVATSEQVRGGLSPWQVRKVTSFIETHLDRSIRNEDLAALVRLNASHFGRAFRNSLGEPPHEYVIRRRVERAQGLMLSTDAPLSEIALDCGLADQSHLTRLFRRVVGDSPRAWRRARLSAPL